MNRKMIGTLMSALLWAPGCANEISAPEPVSASSKAIGYELEVISTTTDGSLTCYRETTVGDNYARICIFCIRSDGQMNGSKSCRFEYWDTGGGGDGGGGGGGGDDGDDGDDCGLDGYGNPSCD